MDTGLEPSRARSKIGLMQKRSKARSDTGTARERAWHGSLCSTCGGPCIEGRSLCFKCATIDNPYTKKLPPTIIGEPYDGHGYSAETRRRLDRMLRGEPLDDPPAL